MRIGIDARLGFGDSTGLGVYTRRLIDALGRHDHGNEFMLYTDRAVEDCTLPQNFRIRHVPGSSRIAWTNLRLPPALHRDRVDLFHGIANFELPLRFRGLRVLTVHDLVPLRYPAAVPFRHRLFFRLFTGPALRVADRVLTPSNHTRREVVDAFGVPECSIEVLPNWVSPAFRRRAAAPAPGAERAPARHGLVDPYFVFVGVREPKKNLERLLEAFARVVGSSAIPVRLALVGPEGWGLQGLDQRIRELGLGDRVVHTGRVSESDLVELLQDARALTFPSLTEGFGLPVLEAMACGTAVVTSRSGALPEVAGDAALLVDPGDVGAIAAALSRLLEDPALARTLGEKGVERAARWREEDAAHRLVQLYLELFNGVA